MSKNLVETGKSHKTFTSEQVKSYPVPSDNQLLLQIFFLTQDESQGVEILETNEIDFDEILQDLNMGETVFIKNKNQRIFESRHGLNTDEKQKLSYFPHS
jgi:hypothetical protein